MAFSSREALVGCESNVRCLRLFLTRLLVLWTSTSPIKVAWSGYQFLLLVQTGKYFLIKNIQKISLYNKQPKMSSIFNAKWKLVQIIFAMQVWLECSHSRMLGWFRISAQIGFPLICCRIIQAAWNVTSNQGSTWSCRALRVGERPWLGWLTPHNPAQVLATWESTCDEISSKVIRRKDRPQLWERVRQYCRQEV